MGCKASHIYYIRSCEKARLPTQGLGSALNTPSVFLPQELCPCAWSSHSSTQWAVSCFSFFRLQQNHHLLRKAFPAHPLNKAAFLVPRPGPCVLSASSAEITACAYWLFFPPSLLTSTPAPRGAGTAASLKSGPQSLHLAHAESPADAVVRENGKYLSGLWLDPEIRHFVWKVPDASILILNPCSQSDRNTCHAQAA